MRRDLLEPGSLCYCEGRSSQEQGKQCSWRPRFFHTGAVTVIIGGSPGGNVEKNRDTVHDIRVGSCDSCNGVAWIYVGLLLGAGDAEIHMDAQACLNGCDPLIISITVHT